MLPRFRNVLPALLLTLCAVAPLGAQEAPSLRETVIAADEAGRHANRAFAPLRRGVPADRAAWSALGDLYEVVGEVADAAERVHRRARDLDDLEVTRGEFRRRLARLDSLVAASRTLASGSWREGLPEEDAEARTVVARRARQAKDLADRTVAAADAVAYAVGVTEGVDGRSISLSLVGVIVVFVVLTLISAIVGLIRKLDDDWQQREQESEAAALEREPTIDTTTLLLISAACATVITGRFRVRRIRRLLSPRTKRTPWSAQGRLMLQGSHTVSRKS
jgi:Na+-transporting methylmalonyl-CoA/oxaloacetate decarboxylase gamma subunit